MIRPENPQTLRERVRDALCRRVGSNRPFTVKGLAQQLHRLNIPITARTIENLMAGNNEPRSSTLEYLMGFFDQSFSDEIFASKNFRIVKLSDHRARELMQQRDQIDAEIEALGKGAA